MEPALIRSLKINFLNQFKTTFYLVFEDGYFLGYFKQKFGYFCVNVLAALKKTKIYQMSDSVEKMEAEWPGDDQLGAEDDGHAKLKALKTKI